MHATADPSAIAALLAQFKTALLATHGEDGLLRCRPMAMRHAVRGEEIWFATSPGSGKVRDLEHDPRCAVVFFDPAAGTTISVSGTGEIIRDKKLLESLWDPSWARWFPHGSGPKDVVLLRVIPALAERHDGTTGKVEVLFEARRRKA